MFHDVCKTPAPFVNVPYPNSQFQENLRAANAIDAKAQAGSERANKKQKVAIDNYESAVSSSSGDEPGTMKGVMSAFQAVRAGRTGHFSGGSAAVKNFASRKVFGKR